jgi:PAS domain-containing protein
MGSHMLQLVNELGAPEGVAKPAQSAAPRAFALDAELLVRIVDEENPCDALDHLADALRARIGASSRVVMMLAGHAERLAIFSRDGRDIATSYLRDIDFVDAEDHNGIACLRINVAGARPLATAGRGAPLLRAIAAGLKDAFHIDIRAEGSSDVVGSVTVFMSEPVEQVDVVLAAMREAGDIVGALARLHRTVRRAADADTRFAALTATVPGVIYQRVVTPGGQIRYSYISENAYDLFGVTAEKILSDPEALFAHYGKDYRETFRHKLLEASRTLSMWDVEATIQRPDGETRYTHAIARPAHQAGRDGRRRRRDPHPRGARRKPVARRAAVRR